MSVNNAVVGMHFPQIFICSILNLPPSILIHEVAVRAKRGRKARVGCQVLRPIVICDHDVESASRGRGLNAGEKEIKMGGWQAVGDAVSNYYVVCVELKRDSCYIAPLPFHRALRPSRFCVPQRQSRYVNCYDVASPVRQPGSVLSFPAPQIDHTLAFHVNAICQPANQPTWVSAPETVAGAVSIVVSTITSR